MTWLIQTFIWQGQIKKRGSHDNSHVIIRQETIIDAWLVLGKEAIYE